MKQQRYSNEIEIDILIWGKIYGGNEYKLVSRVQDMVFVKTKNRIKIASFLVGKN
jgi:hypothetical protein